MISPFILIHGLVVSHLLSYFYIKKTEAEGNYITALYQKPIKWRSSVSNWNLCDFKTHAPKTPVHYSGHELNCFSGAWPLEDALATATSQPIPYPLPSLSLLSLTSHSQVGQGQGGETGTGIPPVLSFNACSFVNKNNHLWIGPDANSPQIRNSSSEAQNNTALGKI